MWRSHMGDRVQKKLLICQHEDRHPHKRLSFFSPPFSRHYFFTSPQANGDVMRTELSEFSWYRTSTISLHKYFIVRHISALAITHYWVWLQSASPRPHLYTVSAQEPKSLRGGWTLFYSSGWFMQLFSLAYHRDDINVGELGTFSNV